MNIHEQRAAVERKRARDGLVAVGLMLALAVAFVVWAVRVGVPDARPPAVHPSPATVNTTPVPLEPALEQHIGPPPPAEKVAASMAHHLARGNTEIAHEIIPADVARMTGCAVISGDGFEAIIDPSDPQSVKEERRGRRDLMRAARQDPDVDDVGHAFATRDDGMEVHVVVAEVCPGWDD